jgi:hypothetical protein
MGRNGHAEGVEQVLLVGPGRSLAAERDFAAVGGGQDDVGGLDRHRGGWRAGRREAGGALASAAAEVRCWAGLESA